MLPKEAVEEFQSIYKKLYNKDIPYKKAEEMANNLVDLYKAVYLPVEYTDSKTE